MCLAGTEAPSSKKQARSDGLDTGTAPSFSVPETTPLTTQAASGFQLGFGNIPQTADKSDPPSFAFAFASKPPDSTVDAPPKPSSVLFGNGNAAALDKADAPDKPATAALTLWRI